MRLWDWLMDRTPPLARLPAGVVLVCGAFAVLNVLGRHDGRAWSTLLDNLIGLGGIAAALFVFVLLMLVRGASAQRRR